MKFSLKIFALLGILILASVAIFGMAPEVETILYTPEAPSIIYAMAAGPLVSTSQDRAGFGRFLAFLESKGLIAPGSTPIITPTDLRLEAILVAANNNYELDILKGTGNSDGPNENKLNQNDIFFVTAIGLGIYKTDGTISQPLYTYPDQNFFGVAGEAAALEDIYTGRLSLTTGSLSRLKDMSCHHMRFVPGVQYDSVAKIHPAYGSDLEERGYFRLNPNIILDGKQTNKLNLILAAGTHAAIGGAAGENRLVVMLHGFSYSGQVAGECGV